MKEVPAEVVEMMRVESVMEDASWEGKAVIWTLRGSHRSKRSLTINLNSQARGVVRKCLIVASVV